MINNDILAILLKISKGWSLKEVNVNNRVYGWVLISSSCYQLSTCSNAFRYFILVSFIHGFLFFFLRSSIKCIIIECFLPRQCPVQFFFLFFIVANILRFFQAFLNIYILSIFSCHWIHIFYDFIYRCKRVGLCYKV